MLATAAVASANDSGYATNGNVLIPFSSTDIAVDKEVLTIRLTDDRKTYIDVDYTFINRSDKAQTILMGFEADSPYPEGDLSTKGHPFIYDFTIQMNGARIIPQTSIVLLNEKNEVEDRTPIDISQWSFWDCGRIMPKDQEDNDGENSRGYAYVYSFNATFQPGENHVHHTYNYDNGTGVMHNYFLTYKLSPAARWADGKIRDFTLRITSPNTAKHFFLSTEAAEKQNPVIVNGIAKFRPKTSIEKGYEGKPDIVRKLTEIAMRNATLEWHLTDYSPKAELSISSADELYSIYSYEESEAIKKYPAYYYDRTNTIMYEQYHGKSNLQIIRNLPYANRGYVFQDPALRKTFLNVWWYIPDPNYTPKPSDFSREEQELIVRYK